MHINLLPLVVAVVADVDANVGLLLGFIPELTKAIEPLRIQIQQLENLT